MISYSEHDARDAEDNPDDRKEIDGRALPADWDAALAEFEELEPSSASLAVDALDQDDVAVVEALEQAERDALRKRTELIRQHNIKRFGRDIRPVKAGPIAIPASTNVGLADGLNLSLAPGCYGMSMCYRENTAECSTCPFASSCKPLAEDQAAMLRTEGVRNRYQEQEQKRQAKRRAALGAKPHSQSASRTKPWEAAGMSRASWYRAGKPSST